MYFTIHSFIFMTSLFCVAGCLWLHCSPRRPLVLLMSPPTSFADITVEGAAVLSFLWQFKFLCKQVDWCSVLLSWGWCGLSSVFGEQVVRDWINAEGELCFKLRTVWHVKLSRPRSSRGLCKASPSRQATWGTSPLLCPHLKEKVESFARWRDGFVFLENKPAFF